MAFHVHRIRPIGQHKQCHNELNQEFEIPSIFGAILSYCCYDSICLIVGNQNTYFVICMGSWQIVRSLWLTFVQGIRTTLKMY